MEITVLTSQEAKEAATEVLYRAGAAGLVVEDSISPVLADDLEDYTPNEAAFLPLDEVRLIAYLPHTEAVVHTIESIRAEVSALAEFGLDAGRAEVGIAEVEDEEWATSWKQYYRSIPVGKKLLIKPSWEATDPKWQDRLMIELDPGMAFGTGTHETTTMCLEILESIDLVGKRVVDLGSGSGILSIAAARLGAAVVEALDYDPVAVRVAAENVERNEVSHIVRVQESDLLAGVAHRYDVIVANIIARIIIAALPEVTRHLEPLGTFIASGIIREKADQVSDELASHGFHVVERREAGEWVAFVAQKQVN
ncbi:MAG TPA: 50S ribosomal protein L11 methyltransferase [Bacillota bacterium]|nr:50S ribosomal protein L11 methyltransferase [Bacillota bacterium]